MGVHVIFTLMGDGGAGMTRDRFDRLLERHAALDAAADKARTDVGALMIIQQELLAIILEMESAAQELGG